MKARRGWTLRMTSRMRRLVRALSFDRLATILTLNLLIRWYLAATAGQWSFATADTSVSSLRTGPGHAENALGNTTVTAARRYVRSHLLDRRSSANEPCVKLTWPPEA